jgi:hypothetical protein
MALEAERNGAGHRWLMPVFLATQKADIRRIMVEDSLSQ